MLFLVNTKVCKKVVWIYAWQNYEKVRGFLGHSFLKIKRTVVKHGNDNVFGFGAKKMYKKFTFLDIRTLGTLKKTYGSSVNSTVLERLLREMCKRL